MTHKTKLLDQSGRPIKLISWASFIRYKCNGTKKHQRNKFTTHIPIFTHTWKPSTPQVHPLPLFWKGKGWGINLVSRHTRQKQMHHCPIFSLFGFSDSIFRNKIELSTNNYTIHLDFFTSSIKSLNSHADMWVPNYSCNVQTKVPPHSRKLMLTHGTYHFAPHPQYK